MKTKYFLAGTICSVVILLSMFGCDLKKQTVKDLPPVKSENTLLDENDYALMWWGYGLDASSIDRKMFVRTGHYGLSVNERNGMIGYIGGVEEKSQDEVFEGGNEEIEALPKITGSLLINADGRESKVYASSYYHSDAFPMSSDLMEGANKNNALRIISSGKLLQRFDVFQLLYKENDDFRARTEYAAVADYFTFTYDVQPQTETVSQVTLSAVFDMGDEYSDVSEIRKNKAYILTAKNGQSIAFIALENGNENVSVKDGCVTVSAEVSVKEKKWNGLSVAVMPGFEITAEKAEKYYASRNVEISAENTEPVNTGAAKISYDKIIGMHTVGMPDSSDFTDYSVEKNRTAYERTPFTVTNDSDYDVCVPVCFGKPLVFPNANYGLWGLTPMLFDGETNEPAGIYVQYARNPHNYTSYRSVLYGACWTECYTYVKVPAHQSVSYDFVCSFSQWGETYGTSIAQMCLVGWGGNQWWFSASYGSKSSYGETFGFDPERGCQRSLIDDTTPFQFDGLGAGGGDWLHLEDENGNYVKINKTKTVVRTVGPCVSEMDVSGFTEDGNVRCEMNVILSRSDDYATMINKVTYTFLEDTEFSRLALWQLGADNYNGTKIGSIAYGTGKKVTETLDSAILAEKTDARTYAKQLISAPVGTWVCQYDFTDDSGKAIGNKGMVIRDFSAKIGRKTYGEPTVSFYVTDNIVKTLNSELTLPEKVQRKGVIPKESTITFTVEYVSMPSDKSLYTGTSEYVLSHAEEDFKDYSLMMDYAIDGEIGVSVSKGELTGEYPTRIKCACETGVVCEFTLSGGATYVPVTIHGLNSYSGYRLYKVLEDGSDEIVDQSVKGNDYWQCYYDAENGYYELSFNVFQNGEKCTYRLKK